MKNLIKILLVDDNKAINFYNKAVLKKTKRSTDIFVAENGKEALDIIETMGVPQIIFLDINMPVMNGWEFLQEFKKNLDNYNRSTIVLMLGTELEPFEMVMLKDKYEITEFCDKILSNERVNELVKKYVNTSVLMACS